LTVKMKASGEGRRGIMIVGEAPGEEEDKQGKPFVGRSGRYLRSVFEAFGLDVDRDCVITNACRCRPRNNRTPNKKEIEACREFLFEDIRKYEPKVVFLCGDVACESYLGNNSVSLLRGNVIPEKERWIVPIYHPAYVLRKKDWDLYLEHLWIKDIERGLLKIKEGEKPNFVDLNTIDYKVIKTESLFEKLINKVLNKGSVFVFDFETVGSRPEVDGNEFLCVGFTSDVLKRIYVADKRLVNEKTLFNGIGKITESKKILKVCQNLKFEMAWVRYKMRKKFVKPYDDTMLMSYVLDERVKTNGLKWLAFVNFGVKDYGEMVNKSSMKEVQFDILHKYNAIDVYFTYELWKRFKIMIKDEGLEDVYKKLLLNSVPLLVDSEYEGCGFDFERLNMLKKKYYKEIERTLNEIYSLDEVKEYGKPLDINSPKQVSDFLFDYLKIPVIKITKSGNNSTDESVLEKLAQDGVVFAEKLLRYRHMSKIYNTYLKNFDEYVINGRIKTNYWLTGTVTGRLSSDKPNAQNIPKGEFSDVRTMFAPRKKGELILSCDYSQWEVRVLQMYANDEALGKVIREGLDMHKKYAMKIFNVDESHPKFKEYRQLTKGGFVFATMYGAGVKTLTENFWDAILKDRFEDFEKAKKFMFELQEEFFSDYKGVKRWIESLKRFYVERGYIETLFGRRRRAPIDPTQLINSPVQSAASDFTLLSAQRIYKELGLVPVLMIHDDLTFSVPAKEWKLYYKEIKKRMTDWDFEFVNVPIEIEGKIGERWGEQEVIDESKL